jgi:hypothetical protein
MGNQVKEPLTKAEANAMTVNERLFVSGLLGDFDEAVAQRDIAELERILRSVYLEPENIQAVISQALSPSNGAA